MRKMGSAPTAAIVTVGTELTTGLRRDTNGGDIALTLSEAGYDVRMISALPDEVEVVESSLRALIGLYDILVVTGGLGPTHDDITREAAARALGRDIHRDPSLTDALERAASVHEQPKARTQMLRQADVIDGAIVLPTAAGTAPGQLVETDRTTVILLPGPPNEMRPLLAAALEGRSRPNPAVRLKCTDITESDAQQLVEPAIASYRVDLTLLAAPGDIEVILYGRDGDPTDLGPAAAAARTALGDACYSDDGSTLAATVLRLAHDTGEHLSCAESCTGGLIAAAITDVPGSSEVFCGGVVAYANDAKTRLLDVPPEVLAEHGAVSEHTARAMARGALALPGATLSVATTGVAGPGGGSDSRPVGLVWFAVAHVDGRIETEERRLSGSRELIRHRATLAALNLLRRAMEGT
ncbi:MAG: nicotinamide-nucleotide amidohydrolase family protein [Coriobacteriia bacterium]|nr:nicotinamide-nucleotide amidohydrolase family protein [Coriobacteriia bacterium]